MNGMRRLLISLATACLVVGTAIGAATAKNGGLMCVLNTQLNATNETTGSISTATGHAQVKVWNDGTIRFKTQIFNPDHETFIAHRGHDEYLVYRQGFGKQPVETHICEHAACETQSPNLVALQQPAHRFADTMLEQRLH